MEEEEGEVERWILWHHVSSYKLREWSPGHFLSRQREAAGVTETHTREEGEEEEEEEKGEEVQEENEASFAASPHPEPMD